MPTRIHIYNPEHDLALAYGGEGFTPPAAGKGMRVGLGFLPAFWACDGDFVLVDDVAAMEREAGRFEEFLPQVSFISWKQLPTFAHHFENLVIEPWGWNLSLRRQLLQAGVPHFCLPTVEEVDRVRMLSHRRAAIPLLKTLVDAFPGMAGERYEAYGLEEVRLWLSKNVKTVFKSPWSSSGRGVRFVEAMADANLEGFVRNVLERQGSIIIEPYYPCLTDFALEFLADERGFVHYDGLSLFDTRHGAYCGNVLATEEEKWELLGKVVPADDVRQLIPTLERALANMCVGYQGPLGVDMMVVEIDGQREVHPCVEVNVRRTMGLAAISVAQRTKGRYDLMHVMVRNGQYKFCLENKNEETV